MPGMHRNTGTTVDGIEHLRQSVQDILTTPLGSRLQRRSYGSLLPALVDQPDNRANRLRLFAATATALMRWERRLVISSVQVAAGSRPGQVVLELRGQYLPTGRNTTLMVALQQRAAA